MFACQQVISTRAIIVSPVMPCYIYNICIYKYIYLGAVSISPEMQFEHPDNAASTSGGGNVFPALLDPSRP